MIGDTLYEHLEQREINCQTCTCNDSTMACVRVQCPQLSCAKQTNLTGSCCPVCEGEHDDDDDSSNVISRQRAEQTTEQLSRHHSSHHSRRGRSAVNGDSSSRKSRRSSSVGFRSRAAGVVDVDVVTGGAASVGGVEVVLNHAVDGN